MSICGHVCSGLASLTSVVLVVGATVQCTRG